MRYILPSKFSERVIRLPIAGAIIPFSFKGWEFMRRIYDSPVKHKLLKMARQVGKSTAAANIAYAHACLIPSFRTLIVHPSATNSKTFSEDRLLLPQLASPILKSLFPLTMQSVFHKRSVHRSSILLRYAYLSAARLRGIPADMVVVDELQDMLRDHIPIIEQVTFRSRFKKHIYCGTPLTDENVIETYWDKYSTQNEWVIPCRRHGTPKKPSSWHWNIIADKHIGKHGVICDRCGNSIDVLDPKATWVSLQDRKGKENEVTWDGYRVCQPMAPFMRMQNYWDDLLRMKAQYPVHQYYNEVLGLPYASGAQPLTKRELKALCDPDIKFFDLDEIVKKTNGNLYAGVDWGTAERDSYTVVVLGGYIPPSPHFRILWAHRFTGVDADPEASLMRLGELFRYHRPRRIGADYGGGQYYNSALQKEFGITRTHQFQYMPRMSRGKVVQNPQMGKFLVSRNEIISDIIAGMKMGKILLPAWEDMDPVYIDDITALRRVYNYRLQYIQFDRLNGRSDDFFHAMVYCFLASLFDFPRPDILVPRPPEETGEDYEILEMDMGNEPIVFYQS